jgi:integrase
MIALRSGLRLGNITGLRVEHLKHGCTEIDIPGDEMKNHERLHVPVHPELREALKAQLRSMTEAQGRAPTSEQPILGIVHLKQAFDRAAKRCGLDTVDGKHLRFHDLRHTFASWLAHKAPRVCEQALLGHSISDVTGRYEHSSMEELRAAVETLPWVEPRTDETHDTASGQDVMGL